MPPSLMASTMPARTTFLRSPGQFWAHGCLERAAPPARPAQRRGARAYTARSCGAPDRRRPARHCAAGPLAPALARPPRRCRGGPRRVCAQAQVA
eukprot:13989031-Alexandrium_andersonii.AAC.1